jgi:hypothetical protein
LIASNGTAPFGRHPATDERPGWAGGHGFWLQGGGVDVTDNVAIGNAFAAFLFSTSSETPVGQMQEPGYPATRGTPWERWDAFPAENLKDPSLARGKPWIFTSHVRFSMARCVGLASGHGIRNRGIMRVVLPLHEKQSRVEDCRFVWNGIGSQMGYGVGFVQFRRTQFIGSDPKSGGLDSWGIGQPNHVPGFITLEQVTIDGYRNGYEVPPRGINTIKGGQINGIRKVVVHHPWGGKLIIDGVKWGTMKGEEAQPIICTGKSGLLYNPEGDNWTRMLQPFELVYNGRQVYQDVQKRGHLPFDPKARNEDGNRRTHGALDGLTNQQLWDRYRLAVGGRLAPSGLAP